MQRLHYGTVELSDRHDHHLPVPHRLSGYPSALKRKGKVGQARMRHNTGEKAHSYATSWFPHHKYNPLYPCGLSGQDVGGLWVVTVVGAVVRQRRGEPFTGTGYLTTGYRPARCARACST